MGEKMSSSVHLNRQLSLNLITLFSILSLPSIILADGSTLPTSVTKNFGTLDRIPKTTTLFHNPAHPYLSDDLSSIPRLNFKTSVVARTISLTLRFKPGTYDITLGFIQSANCRPGANAFHILFSDKLKLQSFDIFSAASNDCSKPVGITFSNQAVKSSAFHLQLIAISGVASISYLRIRPPRYNCNRSTKKGLPDHLAHAVPGKYPTYTDWKGSGKYTVYLNGRGSHSHYTYAGKNSRLVSYRWSLASSGLVLSTKSTFSHDFPVGTTRVSLAVVDEACDRHVAYTTIHVTTTVQPGAHCYYYPHSKMLPPSGTLFSKFYKPFFSASSPSANFKLLHSPTILKERKFISRCIFFIEFTGKNNRDASFHISTTNTGLARLYSSSGLILDTSMSTTSRKLNFPVGLASFELIYRRDSISRVPHLRLLMSSKLPNLYYDQSSILPIVSSITPKTGSLRGGTTVSILGSGLNWPLKIFFGKSRGIPEWRGSTSNRLFVRTPPAPKEKVVDVFVQAKPGIESNSLKFNFSDACDAISFKQSTLRLQKNNDIPLATSIVHGNDGKYYISSAIGKVFLLEVDTMKSFVKSMCSSSVITDIRYRRINGQLSPRSILGMTLDPRDKVPRPYISLSTMMWQHTINPNGPFPGWSNGAVVRLIPTTAIKNNICLKYDKHIVRNLPVSPRDHAVNSLVFTQNGDLLISLGGHTNAGLPGYAMGGTWETYFSASIIIAKLSNKNFNGDIPYINPNNPRTARPKKDYNDVKLYATGLRNLFSLVMLRNGRIVGIDMGSNCGQGDVSSSCSEYDENRIRGTGKQMSRKIPGRVIVDRTQKQCMYGPSRTDKLVEIKQGKFYGHSNLQRGGSECQWIDPDTNRPPGGVFRAPSNYEKPLSMVFSAKTGVKEYGSNLFCGELRNDLLLSQYSEQGTWRVRIGVEGKVIDEPYDFIKRYSGISIEENVHGDMYMPRYKKRGIFVAKAVVRENKRKGIFLINALPYRHGLKGGTPITLGGWGFGRDVKVLIGGRLCRLLPKILRDRELTCIVPPGKKGSNKAQDILVVRNGNKSILKEAVLYMKV